MTLNQMFDEVNGTPNIKMAIYTMSKQNPDYWNVFSNLEIDKVELPLDFHSSLFRHKVDVDRLMVTKSYNPMDTQINAYFENIPQAIKDKYPNITTESRIKEFAPLSIRFLGLANDGILQQSLIEWGFYIE